MVCMYHAGRCSEMRACLFLYFQSIPVASKIPKVTFCMGLPLVLAGVACQNEIFRRAKQMVKERQDITGLNCIKGASGKVMVDEWTILSDIRPRCCNVRSFIRQVAPTCTGVLHGNGNSSTAGPRQLPFALYSLVTRFTILTMTKRKTKEDMERGCTRGLSSTYNSQRGCH